MAVIGSTVLLGYGDVSIKGLLNKKDAHSKIVFSDLIGLCEDADISSLEADPDSKTVEIAFDLDSGLVLYDALGKMLSVMMKRKEAQNK